MNAETPRDPAVQFSFTSVRHYQSWVNHQTFQRGATMVAEMIGTASPEKLTLLRDHLVAATVDDVFDANAAARALHTFFQWRAVDGKK